MIFGAMFVFMTSNFASSVGLLGNAILMMLVRPKLNSSLESLHSYGTLIKVVVHVM